MWPSLPIWPRPNWALVPQSREALITLLWPELEPSRGRAGLRRNLSLLKKTLGGEWPLVDRETVGLDPEVDRWLDAEQFLRLLQACKGHSHPQAEVCPKCLSTLDEAVGLYRGDVMSGFTIRDSPRSDEWQFLKTESLRQQLAWAQERLVEDHTAKLLAGLLPSSKERTQLLREARAAVALDHPNIVAVHDVLTSPIPTIS
jgi:DNA-binding SARP family transcriptional activator